MKQITKYIENGRTFYIFKAEDKGVANGYWAFEDKDIDSQGRLKKEYNGITGFHSKELGVTISRVSMQIKVDALVESGMDRMLAAIQVCTAQ